MNTIIKKLFANFSDKEIYCFTLTNTKGNSVSVINYGGIITSWIVKDKNKTEKNIVVGFADMNDYLNDRSYFGCIVGRYANRIANGQFSINGTTYVLACNDAGNHLHGGNRGFDKVIWDASIIKKENPVLLLNYFSRDGEEGYPGNLNVTIEMMYTDDDELIIGYFAETDKTTPVNLTSHCYFNLTGDMSKSILDHSLLINADHYTPVNEKQIPVGELRPVDETAFDLRELARLGERQKEYDHNFVLNKDGNNFSFAALLADPDNELQLSVFTTEPGLQLYTGNLLDGTLKNHDGKAINKYSALCLETQHFPDSPNQPGFPSTILLPGKKYFSKTVYKIITD